MSRERLEILKMVADKTITVEQAERLLNALNQGDQESGQAAAPPPPGRAGSPRPLESLSDLLSSIGPTVKQFVDQAMTGLTSLAADFTGEYPGEEEDLQDWQPVGKPGEGIPLSAGATLVIRNTRTWGVQGADLVVEGVEGGICLIEGDPTHGFHAFRSPDRLDIRWAEGKLRVRVPRQLGKLVATTMGGGLQVSGVPSQMHLRTFSGALDLDGLHRDFKARTMGGAMAIRLAPTWQGKGEAVSMGGDITLTFPDEVKARVQATSRGGRVEVSEQIGPVEHSRGTASHRAAFTLGQQETESTLTAKSLGGTIRFQRG